MQEILPGIFHWTTFHEGIGQPVHSAFVLDADPPFLVDPRVPAAGLDWFAGKLLPANAYLTNRHHYRHSGRFREAFGLEVWCHRQGLHEFTKEEVRPFDHGTELPGGPRALKVGGLCPEETALLIPAHGGVLALGDCVIRDGDGDLGFVPDNLMGKDPQGVKAGLRRTLLALIENHACEHLLLAHGEPWLDGGGAALRRFLEG